MCGGHGNFLNLIYIHFDIPSVPLSPTFTVSVSFPLPLADWATVVSFEK